MRVSGKRIRLDRPAPDRFWFKLCSKMIHPTAWSINILLHSDRTDFYRLELGAYAFTSALRGFCSLTRLPLPGTIGKTVIRRAQYQV